MEKMFKVQKKIKSQNASITLFTLVSMMFFTVVLVGVYVSVSGKIQKQQKEIEKIQKSYVTENIDNLYEKVKNKIGNDI